jgi:hypothetical protein
MGWGIFVQNFIAASSQQVPLLASAISRQAKKQGKIQSGPPRYSQRVGGQRVVFSAVVLLRSAGGVC